jgi:uncharacterized membrane protein
MLIKKMLKIVVAVMAVLIGIYPSIYFLTNRSFGLLQTKSEALLTNVIWNTGFYMHIIFGGFALLVGWTQFSVYLRTKKLKLHKQIGKAYVIASLLSAVGGFYIAFYATGGIIASLGFISLSLIWFYTTLKAYLEIKAKRIREHQKLMIYSYAACFSAVTLRIYLPIFTMLFSDFIKAYLLVAWLCWIPNIIVAFFLVSRIQKQIDKSATSERLNVYVKTN